jgi:hypothetical protein
MKTLIVLAIIGVAAALCPQVTPKASAIQLSSIQTDSHSRVAGAAKPECSWFVELVE